METSSGGVWGGLKRTFSGEKFFIKKFTKYYKYQNYNFLNF